MGKKDVLYLALSADRLVTFFCTVTLVFILLALLPMPLNVLLITLVALTANLLGGVIAYLALHNEIFRWKLERFLNGVFSRD